MGIVKNLSYAIVSNVINLVVSLLTSLVVPKLIGVEAFGYWQLYLFYSLYIGFLHFGWNDGIYLRYGGCRYEDLNKSEFGSQFYLLLALQVFFALLVFGLTFFWVTDIDRGFVYNMVALTIIVVNLRWMLVYILQATNRIQEYAHVLIVERLVYVILLVFLLVFGYRNFRLMLVVDVIGKFCSLAYAVYLCREITMHKWSFFSVKWTEVFLNIKSGIKLMFSTLASLLMIGNVRFGVERAWDISTFGKISLTLSAANLMMVFINTIGIVIYPILRRMEASKLPRVYESIRYVLSPMLLGLLCFYYPIKEVLIYWLPKYADSLIYLAFVFPIFFFEGKMALLINTYLKALREEKMLMNVNIITLTLSMALTFIFTVVIRNLDFLMASIVFVLAFRSIVLELKLASMISVDVKNQIISEIVLVLVFIIAGWFLDSWFSTMTFAFVYLLYIFFNIKDIRTAFKRFIQKNYD